MNYFKVFSNIFFVKGYNNTILLDIQRTKESRVIPNSLYDVILELNVKSISETKLYFDNKYDEIIDEYLHFLNENEYGFFCKKDEFLSFPEIDKTFFNSSILTNLIIDFDVFKKSTSLFLTNVKKIVSTLDRFN
jgi:hypothetical protein